MSDIQAELDRILDHVKQDKFGGRDAPTLRLMEGTSVAEDGALKGGFEVYIKTREGNEELLHSQSLNDVTSVKVLKDRFAEALSIVLANHRKWPR